MFEQQVQVVQDAVTALGTAAEAEVATLQGQLTSLQQALTTAQATDASDEQKIAALVAQVQQLTAQLGAQRVTFEDLEYGPFHLNSDASTIGGSGLGSAAFWPPNSEAARFILTPQVGQYFDTLYSRSLGAQNWARTYRYELSWLLPTSADAAASQALEIDFKNPSLGKMFQFAAQLRFSGNEIRYWTPATHWTSFSPIWALSHFTPNTFYRLIVEAHRDDNRMYFDAITFNGVRTPVNVSWVAPATNWGDNLIYAYQLDGNSKGNAYVACVDASRITLTT